MKKTRIRSVVREVIVFALFFAALSPLRSSVLDWNWVPTGSMKPTLMEGDLVLVNKLAYDLKIPFTTHHLKTWSNPARGDIAVFYSPKDGTRLVKRVIGLPGDVISMRDDVVSVNGLPLMYRKVDTDRFTRDIFETSRPILAREQLGEKDHWVLAFPDRMALRTFADYTVPAGHYFMMGDSRDNSADSRFFGAVDRAQIVGKATAILVSFDLRHYLLPRIQRFVSAPDSVRS